MSHSRRRRREDLYSSSSSSRRSYSRDDYIEQEIIDRAMQIERSREKTLRRQFEYIVQNVQELERRRFRTRSPEYYRPLTRRRRGEERDSSSDRSDPRRERETSAFQVTMIYQGNADEIVIEQDRRIVFKGFLRAQESFTFKIRADERETAVKVTFLLNEIFQSSLIIDLENEQLAGRCDLLQIETVRSLRAKSRESQSSPPPRHSNGRDKSPPVRPPLKGKAAPTPTTTVRPEPKKPLRTSNNTQQEEPKKPSRTSSNSHQEQPKSTPARAEKVTSPPKRSYGPPQLSMVARSDSESPVEQPKTPLLQHKEDEEEEEEEEQAESPSKGEESAVVKKSDDDEEEEDGAGVSGFLQLLQAMSGGGVQSSSSADDTDGIQGLLTRLGIVARTTTQKKSSQSAPRKTGNVENFLLVYLDSSAPDESVQGELRQLVNYLEIFVDADDCLALINSISNEKVLLIVSDELGEPVVSRVQDLQQVMRIYVLCQTEEQAENWSTEVPKIHRIYTDIPTIIEQIQEDILQEEKNTLSISLIGARANPKDEPSFLIHQLVKEILLDSDEMNEAKQELLDFARKEYSNNPQQLEAIDAFDKEYQRDKPLQFFQPSTFLFKMLNKAFRIPEVDILFKLRFFIQHLHQMIIASASSSSVKTVYRAQLLTGDEIEALKKHDDGSSLLSFGHFFEGSTDRPDDLVFQAKQGDEREEVLFELEVTNSSSFAVLDESVVLFTFGLVTRIEKINKDKQGRVLVQLKTINVDDQQLEKVLDPMRKEIRAPYPSIRLVKLFMELEDFSQAVQLGQALIGESDNAKKDAVLALARIYHSLGTTLYEKEEFDQALDVIRKSHALYLRYLPEDAPQLSPTWNNMGSIYLRQGKTDLALEHHERALAIQLKSPSPDLPSIISYSNNIGGVYLKLERYDQALIHFKRALQIEEQTLPANHPELAGTYHRIGGVYFRQNNYEKALEFYDRTLEIELASLPDNHPTVAVTYHNRGTAFEGLGKLAEAVDSAEKAVQRLLMTLPKEHPQVRMNQAYVDRLKQKLWVKDLFTAE